MCDDSDVTLTCLILNFTERGVVWEETIILLPDNVHYVFLSATIPNASQFAGWVAHLHKQVWNFKRPSSDREEKAWN